MKKVSFILLGIGMVLIAFFLLFVNNEKMRRRSGETDRKRNKGEEGLDSDGQMLLGDWLNITNDFNSSFNQLRNAN